MFPFHCLEVWVKGNRIVRNIIFVPILPLSTLGFSSLIFNPNISDWATLKQWVTSVIREDYYLCCLMCIFLAYVDHVHVPSLSPLSLLWLPEHSLELLAAALTWVLNSVYLSCLLYISWSMLGNVGGWFIVWSLKFKLYVYIQVVD